MRNEIKAILEKLQVIEKKVEGYLSNIGKSEVEAEREEKLTNELDAIQEAISALENIE